MRNITVYIAEGFPLTRKALRGELEKKNFVVIGESASGPVAEREIIDLQPNLAVMDYTLVKRDALIVAERFMPQAKRTKIIFFTGDTDGNLVLRAMQLGIHGYVQKGQGAEGVIKCANVILRSDKISYCQETMDIVAAQIHEDGSRPPLTAQEREVLTFLANGLSVKKAAGAMNLADNTIKHHLKSIYEKLGVHTQAAAVAESLRCKFIK